jgi:hypothetical protein
VKTSRVLVSVLAAVVAVFAIAWVSLRSDTVPDPKASFMSMTQALSPARAAAAKCWTERHIAVADCEDVRRLMPVPPSSSVVYHVTNEGTFVGVDYQNRVTVVLTPRIEGNEVHWRCSGSPRDVLTTLCGDLTGAKR